MNSVHAAALASCALGISFCISAQAATDTDGDLLTSVAPPPNSRPLDRQSLPAGGERATYMTSANPGRHYLILQAAPTRRRMDGNRKR